MAVCIKAILTKHLSVDMFLELCNPLSAKTLSLGGMDYAANSIDRLFVDKKLQLRQLTGSPTGLFIV